MFFWIYLPCLYVYGKSKNSNSRYLIFPAQRPIPGVYTAEREDRSLPTPASLYPGRLQTGLHQIHGLPLHYKTEVRRNSVYI